MVAPNGCGKTSKIMASAGLAWLAMYPGSRVVSTAGSFRQVEDQLWPIVRAKLSKFPNWTITDTEVRAPRYKGLPPSTWTIFSTNDPGKAEGYHNHTLPDEDGVYHWCPLLYAIDEAKTVKDEVFFARDRCSPYGVFECSTPGEDEGMFYERWAKAEIDKALSKEDAGFGDGEQRKNAFWNMFRIRWQDCPHLLRGGELENRRALIEQMGENHPWIRSMIFAEFIASGGFRIFETEDIDYAMGGLVPMVSGDRRAAVELSNGGDEQVFMVRDGNTVIDIKAWKEKDGAALGRILQTQFRFYGLEPEWIVADDGGMGDIAIDYLASVGWRGIRRYRFNEKPRNKNVYDTRAIEDHWSLSYMLKAKQINLKPDAHLREQMRTRHYTMPNAVGNLMSLESKMDLRKHNKKSPDRLDCLVMLYSDTTAKVLDQIRRDTISGRFGRKGSYCPNVADAHQKPPEKESRAMMCDYEW